MINKLPLTKEILHAWDLLAERFNTHKVEEGIHPDAAVNIEVGWPILFKEISDHASFLGKNSLKILDYGCGGGAFCKELFKKGHNVTGMDRSDAMLKIAKHNISSAIALVHGDQYSNIFELPRYERQFEVVTAVHSLEWINDIEFTLTNLSKLLVSKGLILFAVFPKDHVRDSLIINDLFEDFDSIEDPTEGFANFNGIRVPVYVRDSSYFDAVFKKLEFEKVLEVHPEYPHDFFEKYNWTGSKYPEMMILAYRKS